MVVHIHANEQRREIEECLAEHGMRPIELLADVGLLTERTTVVHATHVTDGELDLLAAGGATVCACPTTEANLGDGFLPAARIFERGIPMCIGSDSNTVIDPIQELREIEAIARRSGRAPKRARAAGRRRPDAVPARRSARPTAPARSASTGRSGRSTSTSDARQLAGVAPEHRPSGARLRRGQYRIGRSSTFGTQS